MNERREAQGIEQVFLGYTSRYSSDGLYDLMRRRDLNKIFERKLVMGKPGKNWSNTWNEIALVLSEEVDEG